MASLKKKANKFWEKYSKMNLSMNSLMNLEPNEKDSIKKFEIEKERLLSAISFSKSKVLVDLGGGVGLWSRFFSSRVKSVILVENQKKFCDIARDNLHENNILIVESDVVDFNLEENSCDYVFISGVTIYLDDNSLELMLQKVSSYLKSEGLFILRDAYGTKGRFLLNQKYSSKLKSNYSAVYRTRKEYDNLICEKFNFEKIYMKDMYEENTELNKWSETRLMLAIYKNSK